MNQKHEPLTNAMFEPKSPEALEQLDEIERRLKAARPQPPRLDLAALQRLANDATVDAVVERRTNRKPGRAVARRQRQMRGRMLGIVGSWACGAAVGAIVMFVLMSRGASGPDQNNNVVHIEKETPDSITHDPIAEFSADGEFALQDDSPAVEKADRRDLSADMLTMLLDPLGNTDSAYLEDGPTLQVGMYLRQHAERSMWPLPRTEVKERSLSNADERGHSEARTKSKPYPEPDSAVTPRELMREFLREASGAVL